MFESLLDLLFPPRCAGCAHRGAVLCATCLERCRSRRRDLAASQRSPYPSALLDSVYGLYHYDTPLREAVLKLKYGPQRRLAAPLGALFSAALPPHVHACEAVQPVPLHRVRLRQRGFNQSLLLANAVATALGKPVFNHLERVRQTAQQVGLDQAARVANVRDAFVWPTGVAVPERVLLIDDVVTTGSTLQECARALRAAGAQEVHALALVSGDR